MILFSKALKLMELLHKLDILECILPTPEAKRPHQHSIALSQQTRL